MIEHDVPFQFGIRDFARSFVEVLPCPEIRAFRRFRKFAVLAAFRVDKRNVALVGFRLFVHQIEHARGARKPHGDHGNLLRHFVYRQRGSSCHAEERDNKAERDGNQPRFQRGNADIVDAGSEQQAAADGEEHVREVADIAEDRT